MSQQRRKFSSEFRDEAVKMVVESSRPIAQAASELGMHEGTFTIDIPARTIELAVDAAELERRRHRWHPPPPLPGNGFLARYSCLVGCASEGALVGATPP